MLLDVSTTSGIMLAKVVRETKDGYVVRYLSPSKHNLYDYEKEDSVIENAMVSGVYEANDTEEAAGFTKVEGGYAIMESDDEDYVPDSESESESESLTSSDLETDEED
jgi:hypothetical protein